MLYLITNIICLVLIFYMFIYANGKITGLPDTIPVHFNLSGKADGFGSKKTIYLFPVISVVLFILFNVTSNGQIDYPVPITPENQKIQFFISKVSYNLVVLSTIWLFYVIEKSIVEMVESGAKRISFGIWLATGFVLLSSFLPIIFSYIYR